MRAIATNAGVRSWMFDSALPFWAEHGIDRDNGGFVEQLTLDGANANVPFKRTRVTCRQIYVFSHAATLGWQRGNELAAHGVEFLTQKTWLGSDKGFVRTLTRIGDPLDATPDLYDHAFALFAFSWRHKAMGDALSRDWMHRTLDYIDGHMRHPSGLGFWHEMPARGWRQQNPHMHLTEACLAAFAATGEKRFAETAGKLIDLFNTKFFDLQSETLAEYFTDDLSRAPGADGRIVEPGHQMEWAWILEVARRQLGLDTADRTRALIRFAEAHGVDRVSNITYNSVRDDGAALDRGSRSWPNTERLKAAVALWELDRVDPSAVIEPTLKLLFERYLGREPAGTWMDAFDESGMPLNKTVPASTLYHVFLAFAEVLRISA